VTRQMRPPAREVFAILASCVVLLLVLAQLDDRAAREQGRRAQAAQAQAAPPEPVADRAAGTSTPRPGGSLLAILGVTGAGMCAAGVALLARSRRDQPPLGVTR